MSSQKSKIRKSCIEKRSILNNKDVSHISRKVSDKLESSIDWSNINSVHLYLAIRKNNEIDTTHIIAFLQAFHPHIDIYASKFDSQAEELIHGILKEDTIIDDDKFGIPTPTSADKSLSSIKFDLIIVPMISYDDDFNRLGYGGGTYDRFLSSQKSSYKVGLAYKMLKQEAIPTEEHDVKMDLVLAA